MHITNFGQSRMNYVDASSFNMCNKLNSVYWAFHTHTHTQPFYGSVDFVRDHPGKPVAEETFTHSHSSWSSIIPLCRFLCLNLCCFCKTKVEMLKLAALMAKCLVNNL